MGPITFRDGLQSQIGRLILTRDGRGDNNVEAPPEGSRPRPLQTRAPWRAFCFVTVRGGWMRDFALFHWAALRPVGDVWRPGGTFA
jgi:hypothetical protein